MVIKKKKLFYDIGIRYVWILCIYVVMSISLNEIVVRGNDYIAQVTDSMLTGKPVVLQNILIQMSGMIIVGTVAAYFADLSRKYYSSLVQREVRGRLAEHLLHLPYSYFDEKGSGSILTRFSSDIGEAGNFFSDILPDLLVDIVTVGTITAYFIQMDVRLIVILFASYPVMLLVADRLSKKLAVILRKFRTTMDDRTQIAYDAIQGIAIGKSYNLYHVMCARINAAIDKIADHGCKSTRISSMGWLLKGVITTIPVVVCYFFALFEVISNRISVGELLAFTILLSRVNRPLGNVMFCMNDIRASKVAMDRLETLYQAKKEEEAFKVTYYDAMWNPVEAELTKVTEEDLVQNYKTELIYSMPLPDTKMGFSCDVLMEGENGSDWSFEVLQGGDKFEDSDEHSITCEDGKILTIYFANAYTLLSKTKIGKTRKY